MLKNLKIGTRLGLGFGFLLVLMLVVGVYGIRSIQSLNEQVKVLVEDRMVKTEQANGVIDNLNLIARSLRNIYIDDDKGRQTQELQRIADARAKIRDLFDALEKTITSDKGKALIKKILDVRPNYIRVTETYMELIKSGQLEQAKKLLLSEVRDIQRPYFDGVNELIAYQTELANKDGHDAENDARAAIRLISILLVTALILSVGMAVLIVRSITVPVAKASKLAETMAKGDFTTTLDIDQKDEIGVMARSLNSMVGQLSTMIRDIIGGVNSLTASSNDLAAVSKQLSANARESSDKAATVAAATEEMSTNMQSVSAAMEQSTSNVNMVASSTEEMTATVSEIAQNAEKARSITDGAVKQSRQTSEKMAALGESARKIGRVTETITEISERHAGHYRHNG